MTKPLKERIIRQPLGRPSSYRPEYAAQLIEYFEQPAYDRVVEEVNAQGEKVERLVRGVFPTLAGFATMVGVTQITLRNWADAKDIDEVSPLYPDFFTAYYQVQSYQERYLSEGFLSGAYSNPGFGVLIAKNILGWKDKTEQMVEQNVKASVEHSVPGLTEKLDEMAKAKAKAKKAE